MDILAVVCVLSLIVVLCVFGVVSCIQQEKRNRQKERFEECQSRMICGMNAKLDLLSDYYDTLASSIMNGHE